MPDTADPAAVQPDADAPRRRPGGRSARVREAVLAAVIDALREGAEVTVPEVARRSGVHDATIYRRWGNRDALVVDAVRSRVGDSLPVPDTGTLRGDLTALAEQSAAFLATPLGAQLGRSGSGRAAPDAAARAAYWEPRLAALGAVVERAVARGEIAPPRWPPALVAELLVAPFYFRLLVTLAPLDAGFADAVADFVLAAVQGDPPG